MACYTPTQIAQQVMNQGGTAAQAYIAAALASGIESNGCTDDKNPGSSACGIFQFLDTTWQGYGGQGSACNASLQQQVAVFLTATSGGNYHDWGPDLVGGNPNNPAAYPASVTAPKPGSAVSNAIATLAAGPVGKLLGPPPTNWAGNAPAGGTGSAAAQSASAAASCCGKANCCPVKIDLGLLGSPCILSACQIKAIISAAEMVFGGAMFVFGVVMIAGYAYDHSGAKQAVNSTARKVGMGTALLTGQPEVAAGIAATGKKKQPRTLGLGKGARPSKPEKRSKDIATGNWEPADKPSSNGKTNGNGNAKKSPSEGLVTVYPSERGQSYTERRRWERLQKAARHHPYDQYAGRPDPPRPGGQPGYHEVWAGGAGMTASSHRQLVDAGMMTESGDWLPF